MMGDVAHDVDVRLSVLATAVDDAAVSTCDEVFIGSPTSWTALTSLAQSTDVLTFDHELVDLEQINQLELEGVIVRPSASALAYAVDKGYQRMQFYQAGLPVPRFVVTTSSQDKDLHALIDSSNGVVVKSSRGGYDGRGVSFPTTRDEALNLIEELATLGDVVVEERLELRGEVAQVVARGIDGTCVAYPLVRTVQSDGMCVEVSYPAHLDATEVAEAERLGREIADRIGAVGIVAVELFVTDDGLVINELALRPHNSGHWTIEGARTSQFANHLLCVSGARPGSAEAIVDAAVMVNVVGAATPGSIDAARAVIGANVHDYGKSWRPGRKLGHVTAVGTDFTQAHVTAWESARAYGTSAREA